MNPDLMVHAGGGARGKKNRTLFKVLFYFSVIKAMFVNSCLCIVGTCNIDLGIMDWKSTCHGTVICAVMVQWLCPPNRRGGGGTYCFWCGSRRCGRLRPRSFISARYLLNRWTDFDQTCTDTLLGGRNELIRFWWPWPNFQGHSDLL